MSDKVILLLEDTPGDEGLILWGLKKNNILNKVIVARVDEEALRYLLGTGKYEEGDTRIQLQVILLGPQRPKTKKQLGLYWLMLHEIPVKRGESWV